MKKISADWIYTMTGEPLQNAVLVVDEAGRILAIESLADHDPASVQVIKGGVIVPGLVNTHCHLELSHMKGLAETGTGLVAFLQKVVNFRDFPMEEILEAIQVADQYMYDAGIVAVGDISNKLDTVAQKDKSQIRYYTFVEMFDFLSDDQAASTFDNYLKVFQGQSTANGNQKRCVPHSPYTVSKKLFRLINEVNPAGSTVSIHNQETAHENQFFLDKTGDFLHFYDSFNLPIDFFEPTGKPSIQYAMEHMDPTQRTLFVHNTMTTPTDLKAAHQWSNQVYWATCPNANLYIENRLPNYQYFIDAKANLTIGTDSLTSNWQLSVFEEMKTIQRYQSYVSFDQLIRWATLNGARALGFDQDLGSIEVGKKPGINVIYGLDSNGHLGQDASIERLL